MPFCWLNPPRGGGCGPVAHGSLVAPAQAVCALVAVHDGNAEMLPGAYFSYCNAGFVVFCVLGM